MALGISQDRATQALMGKEPELMEQPVGTSPQASDLMLGGLGLGGLGFAAQTGRAPAPTPMGATMSPLAQQVAANDAAQRAAAEAAELLGPRPTTGGLNPSLGARGGSSLPPQPPLGVASQAAQQTQAELARRGGLLSNLQYQGQQGLKALDAFGQRTSGFIDESSRALAPYADELIGSSKALAGTALRGLGQVASYGGGQFADPLLQGAAQYAQMLSPDPVVKTAPKGEPITDVSELEGTLFRSLSPSEADALEVAKQLKQQTEPTQESSGSFKLGPSGERILSGIRGLEGKMAEFQRGISDGGIDAAEAPIVPAMDSINDVMSQAGVPTQDQLVSAIQAQAPTQVSQPAMGLRTDPQGRMIPAGFETRAEAFPEYEREAAAREARIGGGVDSFGVAQPVESRLRAAETGIPTDAELRDLAKARMPGATEGEIARGMKVASRYGIDPLTGERPEVTDPELAKLRKEQIQTSIEANRARLAEAGLRPTGDPEVDSETGIITQMYSDGVRKYLGQARMDQLDDLDLSAFMVDSDAEKEDKKKGKSITQAEYGKLKKGDKFIYEGKEYTKQ